MAPRRASRRFVGSVALAVVALAAVGVSLLSHPAAASPPDTAAPGCAHLAPGRPCGMPDPPGRACGLPTAPGPRDDHGGGVGRQCDAVAAPPPVPTTVAPVPAAPPPTDPVVARSPVEELVSPPAPAAVVPAPPPNVLGTTATAPAVATVAAPAPVVDEAPEVLGIVQEEPVSVVDPVPEGTADDLSFLSTGLPGWVDLSPARVITNVGIGALVTLLLVAASQLFNDAMKMHHDRLVRGLAERSVLVLRLRAVVAALPHPPVLVSFALAAGLLGLLADPSISLTVTTVGQMLGMAVAVGLIVAIYDGLASRMISRATGLGRSYRLYPVAIAVAIGCLLLSRVLDVAPGVLYGLFAGVIFAGAVDTRIEGRAYARSSVMLVGAALVAWLVHRWVGPDAAASSPGLAAVVVDTAAAALFVGGLQAVIVQLLPTRYVNGEKIAGWNRTVWAVLLIGTTAIYVQFVVRPNPEQQSWTNLWFVGAFVGVAVCFWAWCAVRSWRDGREVGAEAGPPPGGDEPLAEPAAAIG